MGPVHEANPMNIETTTLKPLLNVAVETHLSSLAIRGRVELEHQVRMFMMERMGGML